MYHTQPQHSQSHSRNTKGKYSQQHTVTPHASSSGGVGVEASWHYGGPSPHQAELHHQQQPQQQHPQLPSSEPMPPHWSAVSPSRGGHHQGTPSLYHSYYSITASTHILGQPPCDSTSLKGGSVPPRRSLSKVPTHHVVTQHTHSQDELSYQSSTSHSHQQAQPSLINAYQNSGEEGAAQSLPPHQASPYGARSFPGSSNAGAASKSDYQYVSFPVYSSGTSMQINRPGKEDSTVSSRSTSNVFPSTLQQPQQQPGLHKVWGAGNHLQNSTHFVRESQIVSEGLESANATNPRESSPLGAHKLTTNKPFLIPPLQRGTGPASSPLNVTSSSPIFEQHKDSSSLHRSQKLLNNAGRELVLEAGVSPAKQEGGEKSSGGDWRNSPPLQGSSTWKTVADGSQHFLPASLPPGTPPIASWLSLGQGRSPPLARGSAPPGSNAGQNTHIDPRVNASSVAGGVVGGGIFPCSVYPQGVGKEQIVPSGLPLGATGYSASFGVGPHSSVSAVATSSMAGTSHSLIGEELLSGASNTEESGVRSHEATHRSVINGGSVISSNMILTRPMGGRCVFPPSQHQPLPTLSPHRPIPAISPPHLSKVMIAPSHLLVHGSNLPQQIPQQSPRPILRPYPNFNQALDTAHTQMVGHNISVSMMVEHKANLHANLSQSSPLQRSLPPMGFSAELQQPLGLYRGGDGVYPMMMNNTVQNQQQLHLLRSSGGRSGLPFVPAIHATPRNTTTTTTGGPVVCEAGVLPNIFNSSNQDVFSASTPTRVATQTTKIQSTPAYTHMMHQPQQVSQATEDEHLSGGNQGGGAQVKHPPPPPPPPSFASTAAQLSQLSGREAQNWSSFQAAHHILHPSLLQVGVHGGGSKPMVGLPGATGPSLGSNATVAEGKAVRGKMVLSPPSQQLLSPGRHHLESPSADQPTSRKSKSKGEGITHLSVPNSCFYMQELDPRLPRKDELSSTLSMKAQVSQESSLKFDIISLPFNERIDVGLFSPIFDESSLKEDQEEGGIERSGWEEGGVFIKSTSGPSMLWKTPLERLNGALALPRPAVESENWIKGSTILLVIGLPRSISPAYLLEMLVDTYRNMIPCSCEDDEELFASFGDGSTQEKVGGFSPHHRGYRLDENPEVFTAGKASSGEKQQSSNVVSGLQSPNISNGFGGSSFWRKQTPTGESATCQDVEERSDILKLYGIKGLQVLFGDKERSVNGLPTIFPKLILNRRQGYGKDAGISFKNAGQYDTNLPHQIREKASPNHQTKTLKEHSERAVFFQQQREEEVEETDGLRGESALLADTHNPRVGCYGVTGSDAGGIGAFSSQKPLPHLPSSDFPETRKDPSIELQPANIKSTAVAASISRKPLSSAIISSTTILPPGLGLLEFVDESSALEFWINSCSTVFQLFGNSIKFAPDPLGLRVFAEGLACFFQPLEEQREMKSEVMIEKLQLAPEKLFSDLKWKTSGREGVEGLHDDVVLEGGRSEDAKRSKPDSLGREKVMNAEESGNFAVSPNICASSGGLNSFGGVKKQGSAKLNSTSSTMKGFVCGEQPVVSSYRFIFPYMTELNDEERGCIDMLCKRMDFKLKEASNSGKNSNEGEISAGKAGNDEDVARKSGNDEAAATAISRSMGCHATHERLASYMDITLESFDPIVSFFSSRKTFYLCSGQLIDAWMMKFHGFFLPAISLDTAMMKWVRAKIIPKLSQKQVASKIVYVKGVAPSLLEGMKNDFIPENSSSAEILASSRKEGVFTARDPVAPSLQKQYDLMKISNLGRGDITTQSSASVQSTSQRKMPEKGEKYQETGSFSAQNSGFSLTYTSDTHQHASSLLASSSREASTFISSSLLATKNSLHTNQLHPPAYDKKSEAADESAVGSSAAYVAPAWSSGKPTEKLVSGSLKSQTDRLLHPNGLLPASRLADKEMHSQFASSDYSLSSNSSISSDSSNEDDSSDGNASSSDVSDSQTVENEKKANKKSTSSHSLRKYRSHSDSSSVSSSDSSSSEGRGETSYSSFKNRKKKKQKISAAQEKLKKQKILFAAEALKKQGGPSVLKPIKKLRKKAAQKVKRMELEGKPSLAKSGSTTKGTSSKAAVLGDESFSVKDTVSSLVRKGGMKTNFSSEKKTFFPEGKAETEFLRDHTQVETKDIARDASAHTCSISRPVSEHKQKTGANHEVFGDSLLDQASDANKRGDGGGVAGPAESSKGLKTANLRRDSDAEDMHGSDRLPYDPLHEVNRQKKKKKKRVGYSSAPSLFTNADDEVPLAEDAISHIHKKMKEDTTKASSSKKQRISHTLALKKESSESPRSSSSSMSSHSSPLPPSSGEEELHYARRALPPGELTEGLQPLKGRDSVYSASRHEGELSKSKKAENMKQQSHDGAKKRGFSLGGKKLEDLPLRTILKQALPKSQEAARVSSAPVSAGISLNASPSTAGGSFGENASMEDLAASFGSFRRSRRLNVENVPAGFVSDEGLVQLSLKGSKGTIEEQEANSPPQKDIIPLCKELEKFSKKGSVGSSRKLPKKQIDKLLWDEVSEEKFAGNKPLRKEVINLLYIYPRIQNHSQA